MRELNEATSNALKNFIPGNAEGGFPLDVRLQIVKTTVQLLPLCVGEGNA